MKITVTEYTDNEETHKVVVEADKANISKIVGEYIQQRVQELGLVLDYCLYLSPDGEQVKFPLSLELTDNRKEVEFQLEGCPTDEEMQLMRDAADQEEEEYVPLVEFVRGWKWQEGRGYGYFPEEGL